MAEIIPDSINTELNATSGEKKTFQYLRDILYPDEDYMVWYEPKIINRYPDFIILGQDIGFLVLEVKDWTISQIENITEQEVTLRINNKREIKKSPLAQAREAANNLMSKLKNDNTFLHEEGEHKGKLKFPVGYGVVWTNITRKQASSYKINYVIEDAKSIYLEDLKIDVDEQSNQRHIKKRLKNMFDVWFNFEPLEYHELQALRYQIFPEVRVNKVHNIRSSEDQNYIETLDLQQEKTAKNIASGHRILKGVVGSGKTLVLASRAKILKQRYPNWKILVVCFNISLSQYLQTLINISGHEIYSKDIKVYHFYDLVKYLTNANLSRINNETDENWRARVGAILEGKIAEGKVKNIYDAILVDEGQDFTTEWMKALVKLLNQNTDSLLFCYDPAQNIFGRKKITWKDAGLKVQGKKPIEIKVSYRNTFEIIQTAKMFSQKIKRDGNKDLEGDIEAVLAPKSTDRHGNYPILEKCNDIYNLIEYILNLIDEFISNKVCKWNDIGIIYTHKQYKDFPSLFEKSFCEKFSNDQLFWATRDRNSKLNLDVSIPNVKLTTIESSKGLEFRIVFLVGLEELPRNDRSEKCEQDLTYVGLTRAQDMLYIPYINNTGYITNLFSIIQHLNK